MAELEITIRAKDATKRAFASANKGLKALNKSTGKSSKLFAGLNQSILSTAKGFLTGIVAFAGFQKIKQVLTESVEAARKFEKSVYEIGTLMKDVSEKQIADMGDALKDLFKALPISSLEDTAKALYQIRSAGVDTANQMFVLETAAKASVAGISTLEDSANAIISVIKGYNMQFSEAAKVSDALFQVVVLGQTTFSELASYIGQVVPPAAALGVELDELATLYATLTGVTGDTALVTTQIGSLFSSLIKPTADMRDIINSLGYETGQALIEEKGLMGALQSVTAVVPANTEELGKLFRRKEAITGALALLTSQTDVYNKKLGEMQKALDEGTVTADAFNTMMESENAQITKLEHNVEILKTGIGTELLPAKKALLKTVMITINGFKVLSLGIQKLAVGFMNISRGILEAQMKFKSFLRLDTSEQEEELQKLNSAISDMNDSLTKTDESIRTTNEDLRNLDGTYEDSYNAVQQFTNAQEEQAGLTSLYQQLSDHIDGTGDAVESLADVDIKGWVTGHSSEMDKLIEKYGGLTEEIIALDEEMGDRSLDISKKQLEIDRMELEARKEKRDLTDEEQRKIEELRLSIDEERFAIDENNIAREEYKNELEDTKTAIDDEVASISKELEAFELEREAVVALTRYYNELNKAREGLIVEIPTAEIPTIKKEETPEKKITGPPRQIGGVISSTGMYNLHRGETVIPNTDNSRSVNFSPTININNPSVSNPTDIESLRKEISKEMLRVFNTIYG